MGNTWGDLSTHCCGGRVDKLTDGDCQIEFPAAWGSEAALFKDEPAPTPKPMVQAQKKCSLLQKMGKCCCSNLGDKEQRGSLALKRQRTPSDLDEPECEPEMFKAIEMPGAGALRKHVKPQDLNGKWLCTGHEGDLDQFLLEAGKGWLMRTAAQAAKYGRGFVELHARQDAGRVRMEKRLTTGFWISQGGTVGEEAEFLDELGRMLVQSRYDDTGALAFSCTLHDNGFHFNMRMFRPSPKELHEIYYFPSGLKIKQVYTLMDK